MKALLAGSSGPLASNLGRHGRAGRIHRYPAATGKPPRTSKPPGR